MIRPVDAAVGYAARGWAVFPVHSLVRGRCSCRRECAHPAKHPRVAGGFHAASRDVAVIGRWWGRWPDATVAVATGAVSGIVVLDVDPRSGGSESLALLEDLVGPVPATLTARTGGGGTHLFFAHPGGVVGNSAGRLAGFGEPFPGLDVRGDGGYVIVAPSRHASGGRYRWVDPPADLAPAPPWLQPALRPRWSPGRVSLPRVAGQRRAYAEAALAAETARVATAPVGHRNDVLNRAAFALGTLAGVLPATVVMDELLAAAAAAGLSASEAEATIRSGVRAGTQHPRQPAHLSTGPG